LRKRQIQRWVDLRITAKAETEEEANGMIQTMASIIHQRLGDIIYGQDSDTLENVALQSLRAKGWELVIYEAGLQELLLNRVKHLVSQPDHMHSIKEPLSLAELKGQMGSFHFDNNSLVLGVSLIPGKEKQNLYTVVTTPNGTQEINRSYGGPPDSAPQWAVNLCLDLIRKSQ
jgi:nicotinamide-nucleotide amidase